MKKFGTHGPVNSHEHYVVSRKLELADFIKHGDEYEISNEVASRTT